MHSIVNKPIPFCERSTYVRIRTWTGLSFYRRELHPHQHTSFYPTVLFHCGQIFSNANISRSIRESVGTSLNPTDTD